MAKKKTSGDQGGKATAFVYLRVSTKEQANKGGVQDGYSLPAQRQACYRKADDLGAEVIEEFKDAGESAKTANRRDLQRMLTMLAGLRPTYVIVHKVDRLARNRADDVQINLAIEAVGSRLVSVSENIDATPSGMMVHGIMSTIAEFYSRNLAHETMKGISEKLKRGETPFRAPLGYLNVVRKVDGRDYHTIELDPERADLVKWMFEQYATGDWSLSRLAAEATARGLTTRPSPERAARPLVTQTVANMLKNPYYTGRLLYDGAEYPGKHPVLISQELFNQVQDVLSARAQSAERPQKHRHYLAGSLRCKRCGRALVYNVISGRNQTRYDYFTCLGRLADRTACDLPYLPTVLVEDAVDRFWRQEAPSDVELTAFEQVLTDGLEAEATTIRRELRGLEHRIGEIEAQRMSWAERVVAGAVPADLAKKKQADLASQLAILTRDCERLGRMTGDHQRATARALSLLRDTPGTYLAGAPALKRAYNQTYLDHISLDDVEGHPTVFEASYVEPVADLRRAAGVVATVATAHGLVGDGPDPGECDLLDHTLTQARGVRTRDVLDQVGGHGERKDRSQSARKRPTEVLDAPLSAAISNLVRVGSDALGSSDVKQKLGGPGRRSFERDMNGSA